MTTTRKLLWAGGVLAGALLIVLGAVWIYTGASARGEVQDTITQEQITGSPDMSPTAILESIEAAGITGEISVPTCDVADEPISNGAEARCFAEYMRVHALESTGGRTYSEMGRFLDAEGNEVFGEDEAAKGPNGRPVSNPARDLWVSQRALATGLELAYVGEQVSLFSIATGILFVVIGIGFLVMVIAGGILGNPFSKTDDAGPAPPAA
jgi:putative Mn2+ efflux pump MntP